MRYFLTSPEKMSGIIRLPASKSISNRALILNALAGNAYPVGNLSDCDDTQVMQCAFTPGKTDIDVRAAGTSMRFLTAYLSQCEGEWTITGTERMKNRPIELLVDALRSLGARIEYMEKEAYPPLKISGTELQGGVVDLDGSVSSQYISALMMIAPRMKNGLLIRLKGEVISKPYIRMTMRMMRDFGVNAEWESSQEIRISPREYHSVPYQIESDWSAASYWYEMIALSKDPGASVMLKGLQADSSQGDSVVARLFERLGVETRFTEAGVTLKKIPVIDSVFKHNFVNEPDLAQTFVVTCGLKQIPFDFTGLQSLRIKETDRIEALQREMFKLGYTIADANDNQLYWSGEKTEREEIPVIDTYEDHRMAMSFAPAALVLDTIGINDPAVVSKSYPSYWTDLQQVGFRIAEER